MCDIPILLYELLDTLSICSVANSINWMRLIGQMVYHVTGYLDLVKHGAITVGQEIDVCVPSGNFGNILSAYYCKVSVHRYITPSFHTIIRIHLISLSSRMFVFAITFYFHGTNVNVIITHS